MEKQKEEKVDNSILYEKIAIVILGIVLSAVLLGNIFGAFQVLQTQQQSVIYGTCIGAIIGFILSISYVVSKNDN